MTAFRDIPDDNRFEEDFESEDGGTHAVFADYAARGDERVILHVEAAPELRGSGAAGRFMQSLAEHARSEKLKLAPRCGYAVAWLKRHPEFSDVVA
jgi:predicted GNAT family acetyltransferase